MRGGKRVRAGRKKGVQNKINAAVRAAALAGGEPPLDYLLRVMRDEGQALSVRCEAAKAAAPYLHPRLAAVEHSGTFGHPSPLKIEVEYV